jgi:Asp-tRNA(Asn)/Glu-tRNA(Gln) amidotransferase A subunit family amidase
VRRRAESGFTVTAVDYVQALQLRETIAREFIATAFANADVLITATVAEPPPTMPRSRAAPWTT